MRITVTKEFKEAFKKVMEFYECTLEEIEYEKQRVRLNYQEAERCYLSIAGKLGATK